MKSEKVKQLKDFTTEIEGIVSDVEDTKYTLLCSVSPVGRCFQKVQPVLQ